MTTLVTYGSGYGFSATYATWIAEKLQAAGRDVLLRDAATIASAPLPATAEVEAIIFAGGFYAGTVRHADVFADLARTFPEAPLFFLSVAWTSPERTSVVEGIWDKNIPADLRPRTRTFHARGGMAFSRLSLKHKTGMAGLRAFITAKPESKRSTDDVQTLELWGQDSDFTSPGAIEPLVKAVLAS